MWRTKKWATMFILRTTKAGSTSTSRAQWLPLFRADDERHSESHGNGDDAGTHFQSRRTLPESAGAGMLSMVFGTASGTNVVFMTAATGCPFARGYLHQPENH